MPKYGTSKEKYMLPEWQANWTQIAVRFQLSWSKFHKVALAAPWKNESFSNI